MPEIEKVKFGEEGTILRNKTGLEINPYDIHALEEGIRLKERYGGEVIVLSMGPASTEKILREAVALGADRAILLSDPRLAGSDTFATSLALSIAIRKVPQVDLILCGKQAIDGDTAQVGPELAQHMDIPCVTFVRKIEVIGSRKIKVERLMDNGYQIIEVYLPVLLTVVKDINDPRFPTLSGKLKARSCEIEVLDTVALGGNARCYGRNGSPTKVIRIFTPKARSRVKMLDGTPQEKVKSLIDILHRNGIINR